MTLFALKKFTNFCMDNISSAMLINSWSTLWTFNVVDSILIVGLICRIYILIGDNISICYFKSPSDDTVWLCDKSASKNKISQIDVFSHHNQMHGFLVQLVTGFYRWSWRFTILLTGCELKSPVSGQFDAPARPNRCTDSRTILTGTAR